MVTIAITGSASGIGAASRARLEAGGATVIGVDLRDAEVIADLSSAEGRDRAVAEVLDRADGSLDGLVTCAGVSAPVPADTTVRVNWWGTRAFLDGCRAALAGGDGIAHVCAVSSHAPTITPNTPAALIDACLRNDEPTAIALLEDMDQVQAMSFAYAASKMAVARYVRTEAPTEAWAGAGIRLNAIAPGPIQTPLLQAGLDDETFGAFIGMLPVPVGSYGTADQIAAWIEMMLSPAADFMCGSMVFVDGGTDALLRGHDWPATFAIGTGEDRHDGEDQGN